MTRSTIYNCSMIFALALMLAPIGGISTATSAYAMEGGGGGGGGGGGESDRSTQTTPKKKAANSKKKSTKWNEIVAVEFYEHANKDGLSYYFGSKRRMRRLLERLYKEYQEREKAPRSERNERKHRSIISQVSFYTNKYNKKLSKDVIKRAQKIISAWHIYGDYKEKKITKSEYRKQMRRILDFAP